MPTFGVPFNINLYLLDREKPITVQKGCEVLVTFTLVKEDATAEVALEIPLGAVDPRAPLVRRMIATEHDNEGTD